MSQPGTETGTTRTPLGRLTDAVTVGGYRAGALLAKALPAVVAEGLATPIGFGASFANLERRAIVERHLRRVRPDWQPWRVRQAAQEAFDSYARYWIEALRLPGLSVRTIARGINLTGFEQVDAALGAGSGAILALPHLGGWEWAGRWIGDTGRRITVVVERLEPPELFEWFVDLRTRLGMNVVPLGPHVSREVLAALGRNEIVCLLSDRVVGGGGIEVDFFGERTTIPAGPATLGLRAGAPVFPCAAYFTRRVNGHQVLVRPPISAARQGSLRDDVTRMSQDLADELENLIRRAPEQWHLFQPNWPSDPGYIRR